VYEGLVLCAGDEVLAYFHSRPFGDSVREHLIFSINLGKHQLDIRVYLILIYYTIGCMKKQISASFDNDGGGVDVMKQYA